MASSSALAHTHGMTRSGTDTLGGRVLLAVVFVGGTAVLCTGPAWAVWVGATPVVAAWVLTGIATVSGKDAADRLRISKGIGSSLPVRVLLQGWLWCVLYVLTGAWWVATLLLLVTVSATWLGPRTLTGEIEAERSAVAVAVAVASRRSADRPTAKARKRVPAQRP